MNTNDNESLFGDVIYLVNDNQAPRLVKLIATCGALDLDDPQPALTVTLPDED